METESLFHFRALRAERRFASRYVGSPWWNFRFWLGYRIGGFTHARRDYE